MKTKVNIVPMAGEGKRFIDANYLIPKPFIKVNKVPMFIRAAKSLPEADKWIFICREEHIESFNAKNLIYQYFPKAIIISTKNKTKGQASTVLLAKKNISSDDQILIGTCDSMVEYNKKLINRLILKNDAVIWTIKNDNSILSNPHSYGWVGINSNGNASNVSCKKLISKNPEKDHAIIGIFSFKRADIFFKSVKEMINKNRLINNEFYVDVALDECIKIGYQVKTFQVEKFICWGTPSDLLTNTGN